MKKCILFVAILSFLLVPITARVEERNILDTQIEFKELQFDKLGWEKLYFIERIKNIDIERVRIKAELDGLHKQRIAEQKRDEEAKRKAEKAKEELELLEE